MRAVPEEDRGPACARQLAARERCITGLVGWLPRSWQTRIAWLRHPSRWWARLPIGVLLILGGLLWFLPVLGLWMLPIGLILLSQDIAPLRWATDRILHWIDRRHPSWLKTRVTDAPSHQ